jgi:hypothetical protein
MADDDPRTIDPRPVEQYKKVLHSFVRRRAIRSRITPTETGTIIAANPSHLAQIALDALPTPFVVEQTRT